MLLPLLRAPEVDQLREQQARIAALVHDRGPAVRARHLARRPVVMALLGGGVEGEALRAVREGDGGLGEDGAPLEGGACFGKLLYNIVYGNTIRNMDRSCQSQKKAGPEKEGTVLTMQNLTPPAMAELRVQRPFSLQLVRDPSAVTAGAPPDVAKPLR